jgi:hypothetical protein
MSMAIAPVFLLASERSGTNLLRRRLTQWQSTVFGPSPTHLLKHLDARVPYYGELADDRNFAELVSDVLSLCYDHFSPWEIRFETPQVIAAMDQAAVPRNLIRLLDWLSRAYAQAKGYQTYLCKDNNLFDYAFQIKQELPDARFIYLHRDPRDFTLSQKNRPLGSVSITKNARLWRDQQAKCIRLMNDPKIAGHCYRVSYEELIADEHGCIAGICRFLDVPMHSQVAGDVAIDQGTCADWENLNRPTITNNAGKYRHQLSSAAVRAIESVVWTQMRFLGYHSDAPRRPALSRYYQYLEPLVSKSQEVIRRPFALRREPRGRAERIRNVQRIHSKFS